MYLSQGIENPGGKRFPLCGIFPFWTRMVGQLKLAYSEVVVAPRNILFPPRQRIRGHLFHFSEIVGPPAIDCGYEVETFSQRFQEGFQIRNTLASYIHLHFGCNPEFARSLVRKCHETAYDLR